MRIISTKIMRVRARHGLARKPLEPLLGDYLAYMQALAYQGENNHAAVLETLDGFDEKYPDSLQSHDAALLYASALMATNAPDRAAAFLEKHRQPVKSDIEITLARAYLAAGDKTKASDIFHKLYFEMPTSAEAEAAAIELRTLGETQPVGTFDQRHNRVLLLTKGRRYQDALSELSPLMEQAPPERMLECKRSLRRCFIAPINAMTHSICLRAFCRTNQRQSTRKLKRFISWLR